VESVTAKRIEDAEQIVSASDRASDQGRFAAREFLARWSRETGEVLSAVVTDRMLFAYEIGYLRGHGDGTRASMALYDELKRKENDADSE
jgi:hypothetical protein